MAKVLLVFLPMTLLALVVGLGNVRSVIEFFAPEDSLIVLVAQMEAASPSCA